MGTAFADRVRVGSVRATGHSLTLPAARPDCQYRCSSRNAAISGTMVSSEPVITRLKIGLAAGGGRLGVPGVQAEGQRVPVRVLQHDQRQEVVVPGRDHGEQQDRDDAGGQQRQADREEGAELARRRRSGPPPAARRGRPRRRRPTSGTGRTGETSDGMMTAHGVLVRPSLAEHQEGRHGQRGAGHRDRADARRRRPPSCRGSRTSPARSRPSIASRVAPPAPTTTYSRVLQQPADEDAVVVGEGLADVVEQGEVAGRTTGRRSRAAPPASWWR